MDPDGRRTSTRATLLAAAGQNRWPPAGSYMAATGQDLMAADMGRSARQADRLHNTYGAPLVTAPRCLGAGTIAVLLGGSLVTAGFDRMVVGSNPNGTVRRMATRQSWRRISGARGAADPSAR